MSAPRNCEFCGRPGKGKFCSAICKDAAEQSEIKGPELESENNRLEDYFPINWWRGWSFSFMRIRHTTKENE